MNNSVIRMRNWCAIVSALLFLAGINSGCTRPALRYDGPGTAQEMMAVRYQCFQENLVHHERAEGSAYGQFGSYKKSAGRTCSMSGFKSCLAAKGYYRTTAGRLVVPHGTSVHCAAP